MIRRCAGGLSLPPAIEGMIVEKTDGVPLFLEEMTRAVIESGQLEKTGDRFVQAELADLNRRYETELARIAQSIQPLCGGWRHHL